MISLAEVVGELVFFINHKIDNILGHGLEYGSREFRVV
jgi:hypothetical protein